MIDLKNNLFVLSTTEFFFFKENLNSCIFLSIAFQSPFKNKCKISHLEKKKQLLATLSSAPVLKSYFFHNDFRSPIKKKIIDCRTPQTSISLLK